MPGDDTQQTGIENLAHAITRSGMAGPVILALHIGRPLAWIGGQLLWALDPFLGAFTRSRNISIHSIATLLEGEENVDLLIRRLDSAVGSGKGQHGR